MKIAILYHSETGNTRKMADLVKEGCVSVDGVDARAMSIDALDEKYIEESRAVLFGSPTYEGTCSWQMKKYLDKGPRGLAGKLAGVFVSQNWPGGGGASFAEMSIIAALLVHGMIVYSGGIAVGPPYLHFGAVCTRAPDDDFHRERCTKLGENVATMAVRLFGDA